MEWLAGEKTRVVGTYPPRKRGWTGYVEKDTAGQTNIYSVEVIPCFRFYIFPNSNITNVALCNCLEDNSELCNK